MNEMVVKWRQAQSRFGTRFLGGRTVGPAALIAMASAWIALVGNAALWHQLFDLGLLQSLSGWLLGAGLGVAVAGLMAFLLSLLAWRWTVKPVLVTVLLITASCAHFMLSYGVVMDPTMMINVMQTDPNEAFDLLSLRMVFNLLLIGGVPALWIALSPLKKDVWTARLKSNLKVAAAGLLLAVLAILASFQPLASTMRNHKQVRYLINPLNVVYGMSSALFSGPARSKDVQPMGRDAVVAQRAEAGRPPLLVLVLGETGRAGNFGVNGYERDTTPQLQAQHVLSFKNVWSCGTSTAASVPCMFSRLPRKTFFDRKHEEEGLLDMLQTAGYAVLWIDNQAGCKGVCDRVPHAATDANAHPELCSGGECLDGVMLQGLDARIAALPASRRALGVVLVMHQMGSHGPAYYKRSSADTKRFMPECTSNQLQACSRAELVNAYDNSIAYTDKMLGETLHWLQGKNEQFSPAMVYVADHGESLGEKNLYLHGLPYALAPDVQKRVPWITWMSPEFARQSGVELACLQSHLDGELSHDNYFHSVLGLMAVRSSLYDRQLDAYAACRPAATTAH